MNADDDESRYEGISSFVRLFGLLVPARAYFVGETYVNTTLASLAGGVLGGAVGVLTPIGPVLPFLGMSTLGYAFGGYQQWVFCKRRAYYYIQQYPTLMALAMRQSNFDVQSCRPTLPSTVSGEKLLSWVQQGGYSRLGMSILATYSCLDAVNEIEKRQRQEAVDKFFLSESRNNVDGE